MADAAFITLSVRDNGKGLAPAGANGAGQKRIGMGLIDMRERCAFLGEVFQFARRRKAERK